jgi:hypothetical protein
MTETTVKSILASNLVLYGLKSIKNGPSTIDNIVKATGLLRELVYVALSWLGSREQDHGRTTRSDNGLLLMP